MTGAISTERLFSLSSFEGLKLFRSYTVKQPDLSDQEVVELIEKVDPDGASLDLEAGAYLGALVGRDCPMGGGKFYQACIKVVVIKHQPLWAKTMRAGRKRFVSSLSRDDQDIFKAAGLLEDPPSMETVRWWDDVVGHARLISDNEKMEQARLAEKLSIEHERARLAKLEIEKEPEWPGLDNNYAGYDVLSFDKSEHGVVNIMIEVKSTIASPLRFILTRNEWKQAERVGAAYLFHIWDMAKSPPQLYVRTVAQVRAHIPTDNEKGQWSNAAIPVGI